MKSTGWELSAGLYPGVLIGIRSYQEEKFTEQVFLYYPETCSAGNCYVHTGKVKASNCQYLAKLR